MYLSDLHLTDVWSETRAASNDCILEIHVGRRETRIYSICSPFLDSLPPAVLQLRFAKLRF